MATDETDRSLDPNPDTREGPSREIQADAGHFLDNRVAAVYEDGKPLDLGEFGTLDPAGEIDWGD